MIAKIIIISAIFFLLIIFDVRTGPAVFAQDGAVEDKENGNLSGKLAFNPGRYAALNINNLRMWERVDGRSNHSPNGWHGVQYPRTTTHAIHHDGIIWGSKAYVDAAYTIPAPYGQTIRVGGANYVSGSRQGWVEGFGETAQAVATGNPRAVIYRIRRDWNDVFWDGNGNWTDVARRDAAENYEKPLNDISDAEIYVVADYYQWCWDNWPVDLGAPFIDRNGNGVYDPPPPFKTDVPKNDPSYFGADQLIAGGYDEPGIAGADPNSPADMVIFNIYNDLYKSYHFGSEPTGLEVQNTVWGYAIPNALSEMYFRKIKFINKGGVEIDASGKKGVFYLNDMYVSQWSDPDLGDAGDDLVGCDTLLNIAYVYNGYPVDNLYYDFFLPPPSVGYDILQGPVVPAPGQTAMLNWRYIQDYKNLEMTGFSYFAAGSQYKDPSDSLYQTGALHWYKMLRGFAPLPGPDVRYKHPPGVEAGPFPLAGDPVYGTGHIDGESELYSFFPNDRRFLSSTGPFQMAPGDTQEIVIALVCGLGADRLSSISVMKLNDHFAQQYYEGLFVPTEVAEKKIAFNPDNFELKQNYPNPFNPETIIRYRIPKDEHVVLEIFNITGQKIRHLVDKKQIAGNYEVVWDGTDNTGNIVPSGVYLYAIKNGNHVLSKKAIFLK